MTVEAIIDSQGLLTMKINGLIKLQFFTHEWIATQSWIELDKEEYTYHINYFLVRNGVKVEVHDEFWDKAQWEQVLKAFETPKRELL
jgi:hypothetical protein